MSPRNGQAEQRVRALWERLQVLVEDSRRNGIEVIMDHPVTQWAVRHAEWVQNYLVKSDFELSTGGVVKISPFEAHTGSKAPGNVAAFLERALVQVVKVGTSDMVADALTKAMNMPTDHGGLLGQ